MFDSNVSSSCISSLNMMNETIVVRTSNTRMLRPQDITRCSLSISFSADFCILNYVIRNIIMERSSIACYSYVLKYVYKKPAKPIIISIPIQQTIPSENDLLRL